MFDKNLEIEFLQDQIKRLQKRVDCLELEVMKLKHYKKKIKKKLKK